MDNYIKHQIIEEIEKHVDIFIPVPPIRYRIRCPICGDSEKNLRDAHCYIKCSDDPDEPLLYKCFLGNCGAQGKIDQDFLEKLGIKSGRFDKELSNQRYNKIKLIKNDNIEVITGSPIPDSPQIKYIEKRIGKGLTLDDYDRFKIIWDINTIIPYIRDARIKNTLPSTRDSISFLSDDRSSLMIRSFMDDGFRWKKVSLFPSGNRSFYTIKVTLDIFTQETIVVNIAEGIIDVLSIYKNFNDGANSVFIGILGADYNDGIDYTIAKGFIGSNVIVKVYIDSDINIRSVKKQLRRYKWLFSKIIIYRNIRSKDMGVKIEEIELVENII